MLNDSHIHVGQFREIYTSPYELVGFLDNVGVDHFAVSSTTIWEENYEKVLSEIHELLSLAPNRIAPVLWITPVMLENGGLDIFIGSNIDWKCVKVHGVHPWTDEGIQHCVDVARQLHVPLLFHTGGFEQCEAGVYKPIITKNPDVVFILAHARPVDQTIEVMQQCPNTWADTAFTPKDAISKLVANGFSDRLLWGTDYPIARSYYADQDCMALYHNKLDQLRRICTMKQFTDITYNNYNRLFNSVKILC